MDRGKSSLSDKGCSDPIPDRKRRLEPGPGALMNYDQQLATLKSGIIARENVTSEEGIDIRVYLPPIQRNMFFIIGGVLMAVVLAWMATDFLSPVYRGTGILHVEVKDANVVSIEGIYGINTFGSEYYKTQVEILESGKLAEAVVDRLNLTRHPAVVYDSLLSRLTGIFGLDREPLTEEQLKQLAINRFKRALNIVPIDKSYLIQIQFESTDRQLVADAVNTLGAAFIQDYLDGQLELTRQASDWITERLDGMRRDVETSLHDLQDFHQSEGLVDISGVDVLIKNEIDQVSTRLVEARTATRAAKTQLDAIGETGAEYKTSWETLPAVLEDSLAQSLKSREASARATFSQMQQRYGPLHPRYQASDSLVAGARQAYRDRVRSVVTGFRDVYEQKLADQHASEASLASAKQELQEITQKQYQLNQLTRTYETNQELYDLFFTRFRETSATDFHTANARFMEQARVPSKPVKPRKLVIVAVAGILALIVGIVIVILRELLDNSVHVVGELQEKLGLPVHGVLLQLKQHSNIFPYMEHPSYAEAVRTIRTNVILGGVDRDSKVVLITSSLQGEGKSTIASSIAISLGEMEKTLLIDADLRRPSIAGWFDIDSKRPGLAELINGEAEMEDCVFRKEGLALDVIPCGAIPNNPLELLSGDALVRVINSLKEKYDRIIIDSAPIQPVSDTLMLSQLCDTLIYVVRASNVNVHLVRDSLERLKRFNAPVSGTILNQFDPVRASTYAYYTGNYDYYFGPGYTSYYNYRGSGYGYGYGSSYHRESG